jgi:ABC-2 type transport system ATP-binding protein
MVNNAVETQALRVVRGGNVVLRDLDLVVPAGSVTGLLGPSGCGKSTLMRTIVGVQAIASGSVSVLGRPAGSADLRHRIGYVTQSASVYDDLTVRENLRFFGQVLGVRAERIRTCLEQVDLVQQSDQVVGRLSGGQRSRVSLAVALLGEPDLVVLDEPTVGLDPVLRQQLWGTFHELAAAGAAVFVSSHVMDEAERCHRLLLMREGAIIADDTPDGLRRRTWHHRTSRARSCPSSRARRSTDHDPTDPAGGRRPRAQPDPARPPHPGHAPGAPLCADDAAVVDVRRPDVPGARPGPAGAVPVHHHVPGDQRDHAPGADVRHAGAAAGDADGQARLPRRLRPRVRTGRCRPVGARGGAQRAGARPRRAGAGLDADAGRDRRRRPRHRARSLRVRLRPHRVPGRAVHARSGDPADPAVRPVRGPRRHAAVLGFISDLLPLSYAVDAMQGVAQDIALAEITRDLGIVVAFAAAGLALGAVTLRRQSA